MRILLISLYFRPLNNIASSRISFLYDYLISKGHDVHVICRKYDEDQIKSSSLDIGVNSSTNLDSKPYTLEEKIIRLEYKGTNKFLERSKKLPPGLRGVYLQSKVDPFHYDFVESGLRAFRKEWGNLKFDRIVSSSLPLATSLLAEKISLIQVQAKWVCDFRDSPFNPRLPMVYKKTQQKYLNKAILNADGYITVCEGIRAYSQMQFNNVNKKKPFEIVYNGFHQPSEAVNEALLGEIQNYKDKGFNLLVYTGSLYEEARINFLLDGINSRNNPNDMVLLVGIQDTFKKEINDLKLNVKIRFYQKVNLSTALKIQSMADILLMTVWTNYITSFNGKIFEYLNANRPIVIDHQPHHDLANYLAPFKNIFYANSDKERLLELYENALGTPIKQNSQALISSTKRTTQFEKFEQFLTDI